MSFFGVLALWLPRSVDTVTPLGIFSLLVHKTGTLYILIETFLPESFLHQTVG